MSSANPRDPLRLDPRTNVRFVGDLHLGDGGRNDLFGGKDRLLVEFLHECRDACEAVVFMGDTFDLPQAWRVGRVVRAHRGAVAAIKAASEHIQVIFVRGNHDWFVDYAPLFPAATACERLHVGDFLVWHGHQLDRYSHPHKRSDFARMSAHQLVERLFGFAFRIPLHEHDTWQNRVAHWLGNRYGRHLRFQARLCRKLGLEERALASEDFIRYWSRAIWGDSHGLFRPMTELVQTGPHDAIVCGHTHLPGVVDLGGRTYVNAGSWAFAAAQFGTWDGCAFGVEDYISGAPIGDDGYAWMLSGSDTGDFFAWWARHYRGWLRFELAPGHGDRQGPGVRARAGN